MKGKVIKMKKRIITAILLTSMLIASVSCGSEADVSDVTPGGAATTSAEESTEPLYPDLGEHDFGGRTFTIVYSDEQLGSFWPYDSEE